MPASHASVSHESEHHALTAANLRALEPNLTEQHEVLGRFVGGSNSLIDRAKLQALFRANRVLGEVGAQEQLGAGYIQQLPPDPGGRVGTVPTSLTERDLPAVGALSSEFDYPAQFDSHWLSQATNDSLGQGVMSPTAEDALGDLSNSYGLQMPTSPTKKAVSDLGDSTGMSYQRLRCGLASSEYQRTGMVGQLPSLHPQLQSGMVGGLPLGSIGQIPEGSAAPMGPAGQLARQVPHFSGPVSRLIGPLPAHTGAAAVGSTMYTGAMQTPIPDAGHMVGQYSQIGTLPAAYGAGTYPTEDRLRRYSAPVGQAQKVQEARQLLAMHNSQSMNSSHMQTPTLPVIGATDTSRGVIGELPTYMTAPVSTVQPGSSGDHALGSALGASQVEILQRYYAALNAVQPHQQLNQQRTAALLVNYQQQSQALGSAQTSYVTPSEPSKFSSLPTTLQETDSQSPTDASEAPIAGATQSSSLESKPSNKVRVVCSSNGTFIRQPGGHFEYEGGDTRLVSVSNWFSLASLKEAVERVVVRPTSSRSMSGPPEAMNLKYQLPSDPTVYVDLLDDEDVQLMFDEWADFAEQHKGTSYKLHVYVAWSKELCDDDGKTTSLSDMEEPAVSSGEVPPTPANDAFSVGQMAGRMEIISPNEISLAKFLGSGGYGEVYLGRWHSSEVAIKCLNPSLFFSGSDGSASNAAMADLLREADLLASLRHPNVVWVYGVVLPRMDPDDDGKLVMEDVDPIPMASGANLGRGNYLRPPAVVTEFMSQGSVKQALARKSEVVHGNMHRVVVAMDAAKGMEYLHQKSIVHFDLKSANLLLGYRDRRAVCKVSDFGLSKQKRDTYVSNVTSQRGTLPWIAPEIIKTPKTVTEKVDVYSFGVVLWELWTGREPYEGLNYHALLHQITLTGGGLRPTLPTSPKWEHEPCPEPAPGWCNLLERCWQELPEKRPSFAEIVRELKAMGQALRPPRNRPNRSVVGASVSSSELDARGIPSGKPGVISPIKVPGVSRQSTMRQPLPEHAQALEQIPGGRPPIGSTAAANLPPAVKPLVPADAPGMVKVPSAADVPAAAAAAAPGAAEVESSAPGTPPEKVPAVDGLSREHSEEPSKSLASVASKLGAVGLGDAPGQDQPQAVPKPMPNPFSSAFAYTERMNSAFTSGA